MAEKIFEKKQLASKKEDFSGWYTDVILKSGLADYAPVKGCMVFKPYGYAIWELIQKVLDEKIKANGTKNAYFPVFIPESFLDKEKEHIEGFSPELAVVTIGGGKKLDEKLVVRPTSETIMYSMFSKWISSWRDLPLKINQWCNVVRWEKRPRFFIRNIEFLWQEGHTVHSSEAEAKEQVNWAMKTYEEIYRSFLAIEGITGQKSESEKFPGAESTLTLESLMPSGMVLQSATSHNLGQKFSKSFNIEFSDQEGKKSFPWQTSWGLSSRSIGALIMAHGDDAGLVLPPALAPIQIVIVPIFKGKEGDEAIINKAKEIKEEILKDYRVELDLREGYSAGWKFNEWEMKGVPLRIEFGPKEMEQNKASLTKRNDGQKISVGLGDLKEQTAKILDKIQEELFQKNKKYLLENIREAADYDDFKKIMSGPKGFIKAYWCEDPVCERKIKEETKATTRCLPESGAQEAEAGKCVYCGKPAKNKWLFGQAY
ncbi:MAG: proline--tRNA ligase [Candidatus Pacebacteria bacterium]|nr:proline--tRNA ligase [Candidatus Paceibacterota bacterium]MDD4830897.1 proline--tRNA ligase [Candidatus Paceibacterota bacterium]MDD4875010.1 proline--tRNA ligase [Candidatus Paceibacterota bacterium]